MNCYYNQRLAPLPDGPALKECAICRSQAREQESKAEYMIYCPNGCRMVEGKLTPGKETEQKAAIIAKWNKANAFRKIK